jgi:hypothetical protein
MISQIVAQTKGERQPEIALAVFSGSQNGTRAMAGRQTILTGQMTKTADLASKQCEAPWHLDGFYPTAANLFFPVIWTYNKEVSGRN